MLIKRFMMTLSVGFVALVHTSNAWAYCNEPRMPEHEPYPPSPSNKPDAPQCLSDIKLTGKHNCTQWEMDQYISEIYEYIRLLQKYRKKAERFEDAARQFKYEVDDYIACEALETNSDFQ